MGSSCNFRGTLRIEYWKPQSREAFEFELWDLLLWIPRDVHSRGLWDIFLPSILRQAVEETGEGFFCHAIVISPFLSTNSRKSIDGINRKGKTSSLEGCFLPPVALLPGWDVCRHRAGADVFYLGFHLRVAAYFPTELQQKATRV